MDAFVSIFQTSLKFIFGILPTVYQHIVNFIPADYQSISHVVALIICGYILIKVVKATINKLVFLFILVLMAPMLSGIFGDFLTNWNLPTLGGMLTTMKDFFVF